ncbi:hypothetical protein L596_007720 [Steinernema carpocapsae]|uniref:Uncharacterized protein n=1 Tax=Steinernema carpocapsae TaxID=34508 RepID=A0A4U5PB80_STECR|nr:hypothetical protein L596_007720 [Steinernema carpocapsae]
MLLLPKLLSPLRILPSCRSLPAPNSRQSLIFCPSKDDPLCLRAQSRPPTCPLFRQFRFSASTKFLSPYNCFLFVFDVFRAFRIVKEYTTLSRDRLRAQITSSFFGVRTFGVLEGVPEIKMRLMEFHNQVPLNVFTASL